MAWVDWGVGDLCGDLKVLDRVGGEAVMKASVSAGRGTD